MCMNCVAENKICSEYGDFCFVIYADSSFDISVTLAPAVSESETNKQRQLCNLEKVILGALKTFLRNARNCGSCKIKRARNCGYERREKLASAVLHEFSCVEESSEVRFT